MNIERIIITLNPDGTFRGASATDFGGLPVHLEPEQLEKVAPSINAASLVRIEEAEAALTAAKSEAEAALTAAKSEAEAAKAALAEKEAYQAAMVETVTTVLQSRDVKKFEALAIEFLKPEEEKIRAEKLAQLKALKAELGIT